MGHPYPLGATPRPGGVNFAVASEHAQFIELCLFDAGGTRELARHRLPGRTDGIWHGFMPGLGPGCVYGLRAHGPYLPKAGHRFNPHKLLLDPYAREIVGTFAWRDEHFGYRKGAPDGTCSFDVRDNAAHALKARVCAPLAPASRPDLRSSSDVILYEAHVKGFTRLHHEVPPPLRGTYAGLAHPAVTAHLKTLGVTTLSLMPVQFALTEERLTRLNLANYWGYNTLGFFCPDPRLSATPHDGGATRHEFRAMVDQLHQCGFEVVIDIVFNHTAEGDETGPTLSMRGLDNVAWYRLRHDDQARYENFTGCGNTVKIGQPRVMQFVLDCLRYWVEQMGVDGFRFDLAPVLGRTSHGFDAQAPFFTALAQDPVLAGVRLIAEPWDLGYEGYQLGRFPDRWLEWNDRFRDGVRQFWLTRSVDRAEFARRLLASSDRFQHGQRTPISSVNYVTSHDGFTLHDLTSYRHKHNEANGEANSDGHNANYSINCGTEGPTDDPAVNDERRHLMRALLAVTLLSQGTPMLAAGDELGHTQRGNNNAYCQDGELSWLDWASGDATLAQFVARLTALRQQLPQLRRANWLSDQPTASGRRDVEWRDFAGHLMTPARWHDADRHSLVVKFAADTGTAVVLVFNAGPRAQSCVLPEGRWRCVLDSSQPTLNERALDSATIEAPAQSVLVLLADG